MLPGLVLDNLFRVFGYTAGHTLPVEESLPPDTGQFGYAGHELDPLPIGKSVKKGVELRGLNMLYIVVRHALIFEVVLFNSLEKAKVGGAILQSSRSLAWFYLSFLPPSLDIATSKHLISLSLANILWVVHVVFEHLDDHCRNIVEEGVVRNKMIKKLKKRHNSQN